MEKYSTNIVRVTKFFGQICENDLSLLIYVTGSNTVKHGYKEALGTLCFNVVIKRLCYIVLYRLIYRTNI